MSRALSLLALLCIAGCGVDEDRLVCAPGGAIEDGNCVSRTDEVDADSDLAADAAQAGPCVDTRECPTGFVCDGRLPSPVCVRACDAPSAFPCRPDHSCSLAGLCIPLGTSGPGQTCTVESGCVSQFGCLGTGSDAVCTLVCDPRSDPATCPGSTRCEPDPDGLGFCVE